MVKLWQLKQRQGLELDAKIVLSLNRIRQWHDHWEGNVYIAFSGGKDSTVLLHLIRSLFSNVPAVFCDTGLEYPEIKNFVKTIDNVIWLKPKKTFKQVIEQYGYPVISKENSHKIFEIRNTKSDKLKHKRLFGDDNKYKSGKLPEKWKFLINAPFKISERCCYYLKKEPSHRYEKQTGRKAYLGNMTGDSHLRRKSYLNNGCNAFTTKRPLSTPIAFWNEIDIWKYIKNNSLEISTIYQKGYKRTGCMFCMFGLHLEKEPNKFQLMQQTHPKLWDYCINKLGCGKVLDYIGINFERG